MRDDQRPGAGRLPIVAAWADRCAAHGLPADRIDGPAAAYLVTAVEAAVRRGTHTPHLGRAARSWGAGFGAPGDVVAAVACLREVLTGSDGDVTSSSPGSASASTLVDRDLIGERARRDHLHQVLDQVMLQAVDAAAGRLQTAARTDPLTGSRNRRALADDLRRAVASALDTGADVAVVAIDLDGLKQVNDTHGHAAGDAAILGLVSTLQGTLREADSVYRVGGDEFVVLAPFTDAAGARELMRRAERAGGPAFSWGVASLASGVVGPGDDPHLLVQAADADLYERRRVARRQRALDAHRRRLLTAATVAASVAATVVASVELGGSATHRPSTTADAAPGHRLGRGVAPAIPAPVPMTAQSPTTASVVPAGTGHGAVTTTAIGPANGTASSGLTLVDPSGSFGALADQAIPTAPAGTAVHLAEAVRPTAATPPGNPRGTSHALVPGAGGPAAGHGNGNAGLGATGPGPGGPGGAGPAGPGRAGAGPAGAGPAGAPGQAAAPAARRPDLAAPAGGGPPTPPWALGPRAGHLLGRHRGPRTI